MSARVQCPWEPEDGAGSPRTGVTAVCVVPCGAWNPTRHKEEQLVLLTAEPTP